MTKKMLIDDTQKDETRVVIVDGNRVEDVEFESTSRKSPKITPLIFLESIEFLTICVSILSIL